MSQACDTGFAKELLTHPNSAYSAYAVHTAYHMIRPICEGTLLQLCTITITIMVHDAPKKPLAIQTDLQEAAASLQSQVTVSTVALHACIAVYNSNHPPRGRRVL